MLFQTKHLVSYFEISEMGNSRGPHVNYSGIISSETGFLDQNFVIFKIKLGRERNACTERENQNIWR